MAISVYRSDEPRANNPATTPETPRFHVMDIFTFLRVTVDDSGSK